MVKTPSRLNESLESELILFKDLEGLGDRPVGNHWHGNPHKRPRCKCDASSFKVQGRPTPAPQTPNLAEASRSAKPVKRSNQAKEIPGIGGWKALEKAFRVSRYRLTDLSEESVNAFFEAVRRTCEP